MSLDNAAMTVYGDSISGNCLKVKFVADRLGIPHEWVETSVIEMQTRTPEFLALNPAGQVPVATWPDGRILTQSNAIILLLARYVFHVPMIGSLSLLSGALIVFIIANLAIGYTFSTIAQNQLQAMQMTMFFLLPSILVSGFAFPFMGMPVWARWIGEALPATHFLRIVRGILLKGNGTVEIWPDLWPLVLFTLVAGSVALLRFRRTLD